MTGPYCKKLSAGAGVTGRVTEAYNLKTKQETH